VRGGKTVRLHAPQQTAALYPKAVHGEVMQFGRAAREKMNAAHWELRFASCVTCET